jgi:hypothetical protein
MYACIPYERVGGNSRLVPYSGNIAENEVLCLRIEHLAQLHQAWPKWVSLATISTTELFRACAQRVNFLVSTKL